MRYTKLKRIYSGELTEGRPFRLDIPIFGPEEFLVCPVIQGDVEIRLVVNGYTHYDGKLKTLIQKQNELEDKEYSDLFLHVSTFNNEKLQYCFLEIEANEMKKIEFEVYKIS